jgi:hypothetical protein
MERLYFAKKSNMTAFANESGLEIIRCKQPCKHVPQAVRPAILLVKTAILLRTA